MAEVLLEYENQLAGPDGVTYEARVCGRGREDGLWEGWVEFVPLTGGTPVLRTGRETTQPSRDLLLYWARGLTLGYLDGALTRVLKPLPRLTPRAAIRGGPAYEGPEEREVEASPSALPYTPPPARAVLDPFAVYAEGDQVLDGQLSALDEGQLRNIIRAYGLGAARWGALERLTHAELKAHIVAEVRSRRA